MIDATAFLTRGTAFLAGETIECAITFSCPEATGSGQPECLAWASAQLHCQCNVKESKVIIPPQPITRRPSEEWENIQSSSNTSFAASRGEKGVCILLTQPKILFCDLKMKPGETKTIIYSETIPRDAPPSYRGQDVKYSYKVTIGVQRIGSPIKLIKVPFRLMVLYGLDEATIFEGANHTDAANPFLEGDRPKNTLLDRAVQILTTITSRKSPNSYNITNAQGAVAKFCLFKPAFKLGEDIIGTIDFSDASVACLQYSVVLQCEEQISEECRRRQQQTSTTVASHSKHQEFCLHLRHSHMVLPIPLHVTPAFITDIVCLRWRLHFEFTTSKEPIPEHGIPTDQSESAIWQGPDNVSVDTLVWNLPIKILPINPLHATSYSAWKATNLVSV